MPMSWRSDERDSRFRGNGKEIGEMNMNDVQRRKELAGELGRAICNLANIAEDWNDAQAR